VQQSQDLEFAVAEYIDWFNHRRLHGQIGHVPPIEIETAYHATHPVPVATGERVNASL
jgi:putative transposase